MSVSRRYFAPGQLEFITSSVYRRLALFDSYRLRLMFVERFSGNIGKSWAFC